MTKLQLQQENAALRLVLEKISELDTQYAFNLPDSVASDTTAKLGYTLGIARSYAIGALKSH